MQDMLLPLPYLTRTEIREDLPTTCQLPNRNNVIKDVVRKAKEGAVSLPGQSSLPHQRFSSSPTLIREDGSTHDNEEAWAKILPALEDTRWDFGTVAGLARETGIGGNEEAWAKILPALEDTRWDFRTVAGLARETGIGGNEEAWAKILPALEDTRWDFRTVAGLARETGIGAETIQHVLGQHQEDVRKSPDWGNRGRFLYTLKSRRMTLREILADMQFFITGKSGWDL